jgi:ABC-type Na+ efflux pump permease subunit
MKGRQTYTRREEKKSSGSKTHFDVKCFFFLTSAVHSVNMHRAKFLSKILPFISSHRMLFKLSFYPHFLFRPLDRAIFLLYLKFSSIIIIIFCYANKKSFKSISLFLSSITFISVPIDYVRE